ncbi:MAG: 50S ribosomal protein L9 [Solirubrobacterales bacterium]
MAQAVLLSDVENVGEAGEVVDVAPGYLRNYLLPRQLAQPATKGLVAAAQQRRQAAERADREAIGRAQETAALLNRTVLTISHQAGEDGKLFGSVTSKEVADAINQARGLRVDRKKVLLDEPIRSTGTHMVEVEVAPDVTASVKTIVTDAG